MDMGCLLIGDLLFEPEALADWAAYLSGQGARTEAFVPGAKDLHTALQRAYQRVRRDGAVSCVMAAGTGCDCALALATQLPVDRLALINPLEWQGRGGLARPLGRIRRYARRGAALCVSDVLIIPGLHTPGDLPERWQRELCNSRVEILRVGEDMWINRKEVLKLGVFRFLCDGVHPKSLAQNSEMCIIYG